MLKILGLAIITVVAFSCSNVKERKTVTLHSVPYPPFINNPETGLIVDIVKEALNTQGADVIFELNDIESAYKKAKSNNALMLTSRIIEFEGIVLDSHYVEIYVPQAYLISIKDQKRSNIIGVISPDEEEMVKNKNMPFEYYKTYEEGLSKLFTGEFWKIYCVGIGCDQIQSTNPRIEFKLEASNQFPFDAVYYGADKPSLIDWELNTLQDGMNTIIESGRFFAILEEHKVPNPLFEIAIEKLINIRVSE